MARATITETEAQIEADFNKAVEIMTKYSANTTVSGKTDINLSSVKALMSRYYLYKGNYAKVRQLTNEIVTAGGYSIAAQGLLAETFRFTMNGAAPNSMFELSVGTTNSLSTSSYRHKLHPNGYGNVVVKPETLTLYTTGDIRRNFVQTANGYNYLTGKYTNSVGADNIKMIRYEEVVLNGVEAELNGGDPAKALTYYNSLITQRGLTAATTVTMDVLKKERSKELLGEGLRQWDLLRWGDISYANGKDKNLLAFPIPRIETDLSGTLIKSNPGYDN